jgi:hypothetical protein
VALISDVFALLNSFDNMVDLAYWQGLVTVGSVDQWSDVFSAFSSPGECSDEVMHFRQSTSGGGRGDSSCWGGGLPSKQVMGPAGSRERSFREKPLLRILYSRNLSNFYHNGAGAPCAFDSSHTPARGPNFLIFGSGYGSETTWELGPLDSTHIDGFPKAASTLSRNLVICQSQWFS